MSNRCAVCGNEYDKLIEIKQNGDSGFYDCFECAIHAMAPKCEGCGLRVIGHGVEVDNTIFCSAHCARKLGKMGLSDRIPTHLIYANSEL